MGLIYLDACLIIYLVERHPIWHEPVANAMAQSGEDRFGVSLLVKCECLVGPIKRGDAAVQRSYSDMFRRLVTLDMPEAVYLQAAHLRAEFGLKTPDALHPACARHHRCDALWTNDNRLAHASNGFARCIPS